MAAGDSVWERFQAQLEAYSMLSPGDTVVVAVSGGPDSTALLHLLWRLGREPGWRLRLWVAHLDHGFRGREAAQDADAVRKLAAALGLPATIARMDVAGEIRRRKLSKQAGAREVRYAFLRRVAALAGARRIAIGHNADDQAETVLLHLLRGTGLTGLAGIPPVREEFVRPLLSLWRGDIVQYLEDAGLGWRVDRTNLEPVYARNRVRLQLLPELEAAYNPRLKEQLVRLAAVAAEEDALLDSIAVENRRGVWLVRGGSEGAGEGAGVAAETGRGGQPSVLVDAWRLASLPAALQRRLLRQAAEAVLGEGRTPAFAAVERLRALAAETASSAARGGRGHQKLELGGGLLARVYQENLLMALSAGNAPATGPEPVSARRGDLLRPLAVSGQTALWPGGPSVTAEELAWNENLDPRLIATTPESAVVDLDKVRFPLWLRLRRPGDRFRPLGAGGTQKLKEFFIDHHVPAHRREEIPLVANGPDGEDIIWVAGQRIDERYRVDRSTKRVLLLRFENSA